MGDYVLCDQAKLLIVDGSQNKYVSSNSTCYHQNCHQKHGDKIVYILLTKMFNLSLPAENLLFKKSHCKSQGHQATTFE